MEYAVGSPGTSPDFSDDRSDHEEEYRSSREAHCRCSYEEDGKRLVHTRRVIVNTASIQSMYMMNGRVLEFEGLSVLCREFQVFLARVQKYSVLLLFDEVWQPCYEYTSRVCLKNDDRVQVLSSCKNSKAPINLVSPFFCPCSCWLLRWPPIVGI